MAWRKSPPELLATFDEVAPGPPVELRKMFGYPCAFVNGNLFLGLHQENMILRLPDELRQKIRGATPFEPMPGRRMREYVVLPDWLLADRRKLRQWVGRSLDYAARLPPKKRKAKARKGPATKP